MDSTDNEKIHNENEKIRRSKALHLLKLYKYMHDKAETVNDDMFKADAKRSMKQIGQDLYYELRTLEFKDFNVFIDDVIKEISSMAHLEVETYYRAKLDYLKQELYKSSTYVFEENTEENKDENNSGNQSAE